MQIAPIVHAVTLYPPNGDGSIVNLPEGMGFPLRNGQKYSADIHYINPTDKELIINSAFNLAFTPAEDVGVWMSSFDHDAGALDLPPNATTSMAFDCELPASTSVISLLAHMHQFGERYLIERVRADGTSQVLLEVDEWLEEYRWTSPMQFFPVLEVLIEEGDRIRTTCTWHNPTDETLSFPTEMCTTSGVAIGLEEPQFCTGLPVELP